MSGQWVGQPPLLDDFGDQIPRRVGAVFVDGKTVLNGSWAIMSESSFLKYGWGLGDGQGQRYRMNIDGRWLKFEEDGDAR